jgi:hypothetical protein
VPEQGDEDDEARRRRSLRRARGLEGGGGGCSPAGAGRGPRQGPGRGRLVHRRTHSRRHYLGGPKPPFTPGYELVGVVEELGPGCSRLREGDRVGALTVWGADAERVCEPRLLVHDRLSDASPHREGDQRRDGARARCGRQGGHRGARARSGGRASPLRDRLRARPRRGRAAGSARWRSTTATRTSWPGCVSSRTVRG